MAKPSIRELLDEISGPSTWHNMGVQVELGFALAARVERVLALHEEWDEQPVCRGCGSPWPCPTVMALEGEE